MPPALRRAAPASRRHPSPLLIHHLGTAVHGAHVAFGLVTHGGMKGPHALPCAGEEGSQREASRRASPLPSGAARPGNGETAEPRAPLELLPSRGRRTPAPTHTFPRRRVR